MKGEQDPQVNGEGPEPRGRGALVGREPSTRKLCRRPEDLAADPLRFPPAKMITRVKLEGRSPGSRANTAVRMAPERDAAGPDSPRRIDQPRGGEEDQA